ncbi:N-acetylmuramoyl-L-alanine amidase [Streptomyces tubbatahanensis]|uniref:N-acetylmuramoyl-L-alanine amidase n=1 Tax=Streptomyces tubbatahanensis TaxID=2923272 RepID=A0ABY3Y0Y2_9ACTN|nr:N-acetylmuramoyl-L-alanine amidase [Streptomyces tubbatahanensis]UNT00326.1 N-acetylmuramoyl-L-alanine amidase [Streptomyces tubbatahanensis]
MDSAHHHTSVPTRRTSRRTLLRGGTGLALAAGLTGASLLTGGTAAARSRKSAGVDYPEAEWIPASSSNYTVADRPTEYPIEFVVIHVTQEYYDDALAIFQNPDKAVSPHYLARSADGHVAQVVREKNVAWHAGNWNYNTRSIGIEHEGWVDEPDTWFTDALYEASAALTADICRRHGIPVDRRNIIGHNEVPGADHTDPGPYWDWARYMELVKAQ